MKRLAIIALSISIGLSACSKKEEPPKVSAAALPNHARVLDVIQAGTYTYAEVMGETGERIWLAGGALNVKAGDSVSFGNASMMTNYTSKTLNRTFDRVLFVDTWTNGANAASVANHGTAPAGTPPGHPPMAGAPAGHPPMAGMPMGAPQAAAGGQNVGVVKSVTTAGGYTYVEVQQGAGTVWVAGPEASVKAGDKVSWDGGAVMENFTAKSINKTFAQIVFANGIAVTK